LERRLGGLQSRSSVTNYIFKQVVYLHAQILGRYPVKLGGGQPCPMTDFGISGAESSGPTTVMLCSSSGAIFGEFRILISDPKQAILRIFVVFLNPSR